MIRSLSDLRLSGERKPIELNLPHAGKQLNETTIAERGANHDIGRSSAACAQVDEREQESGQGESAETERRWVGNLLVLDLFVNTRLEATTEGGQGGGLVGFGTSERIATIIVRFTLGVRGGRSLLAIDLLVVGRHLDVD